MTILIENLRFDAIIGILDHERLAPQSIIIDCTLQYPYQQNIFINYAEVVSLIEAIMQEKKFELIETALESLASVLKHHFPAINNLSLTIRKPDILSNCTVGVQNHFIF